MPNIGSSLTGGTVTLEGAAIPKVYNVSAPTANTEVSQALGTGVKKLIIAVRGGLAKAQFSFTVTESGTNYFTIPVGCSITLDGLNMASATLYIQTNQDSQTIEVLEFT